MLKFLNCSQKGRKPDLFQRANDLLRCGSPKIQNKIREIYERARYSRRHLQYPKSLRSSPSKAVVHSTTSQSYIVHPDVKFKDDPFYHKMDTVIKPTALGGFVCVCV